jgi:hypothetical protein
MKAYTKPQPTDVLGGAGSKVFNHVGNKWLRKTIVRLLKSYKSTDSQEICYIIRIIIETIREAGGRFLKFDKDAQQWYDAGFNEAHIKIRRVMKTIVKEEEKTIIRPFPISTLPRVSRDNQDLRLRHISQSYHYHPPQHHEAIYDPSCDDLEPIPIFCHQPYDMWYHNNLSRPWLI